MGILFPIVVGFGVFIIAGEGLIIHIIHRDGGVFDCYPVLSGLCFGGIWGILAFSCAYLFSAGGVY